MSYQAASDGASIQSKSDSGADIKLVDRMPSPDLVSKIGIKKVTPYSLVSRMPSAAIVAKVGKGMTPDSLVARMPSVEIAAKVGRAIDMTAPVRRVHRLNATH